MAELREDQKQVAEKLIELLRTHPAVGLQAPTGWGKSFVASFIVKQLGGKWLWLGSLISGLISASRALQGLGVKFIVTAGKEKMCLMNYQYIDFILRGVCSRCRYNRAIHGMVKLDAHGYHDYTELKELGEETGVCPYYLQEAVARNLLNSNNDAVVLANYNRANKFLRWVNGVIIDEVHSLTVPRIVELPRKTIEVLFSRLGLDIDARNAEVVRDVLAENMIQIAMDDEANEAINLNDIIEYVQSKLVYYDQDKDALTGIQISGIEQLQNKRVLMMSATLPPSILSSMPSIRVQPSTIIKVKIPRDAVATTLENLRRHRERIAKILKKYLDNEPTVIFSTSSKDVTSLIEDGVTYEDEISVRDVCEKKPPILALNFYGRFSEGVRLTCYRRAVLLTVPLLPYDVMQRLTKYVNETDLITMKTVQAIGRILPQQEPDIVMLDKRYWQYCQYLQQYGIQCVDAG